jgi:hypothetical protein
LIYYVKVDEKGALSAKLHSAAVREKGRLRLRLRRYSKQYAVSSTLQVLGAAA